MLNYPPEQDDRDFFNESLQKIMDSNTRVRAEKELVKTLVGDLKGVYGSDPNSVRQLVKVMEDQNTDELQEEFEDIVNTYNMIEGGDQ